MAKAQEGRKLSGKTRVKQKTAYRWKGVDVNEVGSGREALGCTGVVEGAEGNQTRGRLSGRKRLCGKLVCRPSCGAGSSGSIRRAV